MRWRCNALLLLALLMSVIAAPSAYAEKDGSRAGGLWAQRFNPPENRDGGGGRDGGSRDGGGLRDGGGRDGGGIRDGGGRDGGARDGGGSNRGGDFRRFDTPRSEGNS